MRVRAPLFALPDTTRNSEVGYVAGERKRTYSNKIDENEDCFQIDWKFPLILLSNGRAMSSHDMTF